MSEKEAALADLLNAIRAVVARQEATQGRLMEMEVALLADALHIFEMNDDGGGGT